MDEGFLLVGKILRPHGVKGKVKARPYILSPSLFQIGREVFLKGRGGIHITLSVRAVQREKGDVILSFDGIENRSDAEKIRNFEIYVRRSDLPPLEEGEFYWDDILGMEVYDTEGKFYGCIKEIFPTGSNDVWVCVKGKMEVLIPAIDTIVKEVDLRGRKVIIEPMEGLI